MANSLATPIKSREYCIIRGEYKVPILYSIHNPNICIKTFFLHLVIDPNRVSSRVFLDQFFFNYFHEEESQLNKGNFWPYEQSVGKHDMYHKKAWRLIGLYWSKMLSGLNRIGLKGAIIPEEVEANSSEATFLEFYAESVSQLRTFPVFLQMTL